MQPQSDAVRPEPDQPRGEETQLDDNELAQERLYVAARINWIDQKRFADTARKLEKENGECNYLSWLIKRHPDIPSASIAHDVNRRELRRARVSWQAKAKGRQGYQKISKCKE